jgi:hypothetical protein
VALSLAFLSDIEYSSAYLTDAGPVITAAGDICGVDVDFGGEDVGGRGGGAPWGGVSTPDEPRFLEEEEDEGGATCCPIVYWLYDPPLGCCCW